MKSALAVSVVFLLGYAGVRSAESISPPPARVVDAVVDTNTLAIGTAGFQDATPSTAQGHVLNRPTSTSVPPEPTTTTTTAPPSTASPVSPAPDAQPTTSTTVAPTTSTAVATTPPAPTARERGEKALNSYRYDWQTGLPGWEISFHPGRRGVLGYTFVQEQRIEVYVRDEMSDSLLAHVIAHEIGHAIDVSRNNGDDRRRWQEVRGISDRPWWPGNGATDFSTGAGDFAESFAAWQVGEGSFRSSLGPPPNDAALALMAELVAS